MTCEHQDRLLDLVYGELEHADAEALREAAEACAHCKDELAALEMTKRLADELPLEPMPLTARNLIMAAATDAAKAKAKAPVEEKRGVLATIGAWLEGFSALPQVAMAAVMLAVVVVGVSYSPEEEADQLARMVPEPDLTQEAVAELETEEEPESEGEDLENDTDRDEDDVLDDPDDSRGPAPDPDPAPPRETVRETRGHEARESRTATSTVRRDLEATLDDQLAVAEAAEVPLEEGSLSLEMLQQRGELEHEVLVEQVPVPAPSPEAEGRRPARDQQQQQRAAQPRARGESPNSIEPLRGDRATYERAMNRYRDRDFRGAAEELERVVRSPESDVQQLLPNALHHLARSHRQRGACRTALTHYSRLRQRYPAYGQIPQALIEEADCHRRLGQLGQARTLLYRAAGYASTEATAQRELRRIDTLQRAQRRSAPAPAQADSFESAY